MAIQLKEDWKKKWLNEMKNYTPHSDPIELITGITQAKTWFVLQLTEHGIPFALHQLGAGITKITTDTQVCSKCHGTGRTK